MPPEAAIARNLRKKKQLPAQSSKLRRVLPFEANALPSQQPPRLTLRSLHGPDIEREIRSAL
jgi:hypothetical protein